MEFLSPPSARCRDRTAVRSSRHQERATTLDQRPVVARQHALKGTLAGRLEADPFTILNSSIST